MPDDPPVSEEQLAAIRASEPDPLGLMDVIELIAPRARVTGWHRLPGGFGAAMHRIAVTMPSGTEVGFVLRRHLPETGQDGAVATRVGAVVARPRGRVTEDQVAARYVAPVEEAMAELGG